MREKQIEQKLVKAVREQATGGGDRAGSDLRKAHGLRRGDECSVLCCPNADDEGGVELHKTRLNLIKGPEPLHFTQRLRSDRSVPVGTAAVFRAIEALFPVIDG